MKKYIILLLAAAATLAAGAQSTSDAPNSRYSNDGKHKGLDFSINTGYNVGVGDNKGGLIPVEIGLGKQFHPNLYLGVRSGAWIGTKDSDPMIPIAADAKIMFPINGSSIKPLLSIHLGYLLDLNGGGTIDGQGVVADQKSPSTDMILMEFMPGLQFQLSKKTDFLLQAGYAHGFITEGGGSGGYFAVKLGFNFHKDPSRGKRLPREKVDTRSHGLQFTLEGDVSFSERVGGGGSLVCTYKINPYLSVGGGAGYRYLVPFIGGLDGEEYQIIKPNRNPKLPTTYSEYTSGYFGDAPAIKAFARGTYRILKGRFSPFVSLDAGVLLYQWDNLYTNEDYGVPGELLKEPASLNYFVAPSLGVSLRTTRNSYLELKAGYEITPSLEAHKDNLDGYYISTRDKKLSAPFVSLGFTHTFGKRGKRPLY